MTPLLNLLLTLIRLILHRFGLFGLFFGECSVGIAFVRPNWDPFGRSPSEGVFVRVWFHLKGVGPGETVCGCPHPCGAGSFPAVLFHKPAEMAHGFESNVSK